MKISAVGELDANVMRAHQGPAGGRSAEKGTPGGVLILDSYVARGAPRSPHRLDCA